MDKYAVVSADVLAIAPGSHSVHILPLPDNSTLFRINAHQSSGSIAGYSLQLFQTQAGAIAPTSVDGVSAFTPKFTTTTARVEFITDSSGYKFKAREFPANTTVKTGGFAYVRVDNPGTGAMDLHFEIGFIVS